MSITIADDTLAAALADAGAPVEVQARDGRVLGTFTPRSKAPAPQISEEELRRRENDQSAKTFTAGEVEARLRELRCKR
jgi:hypothetical protein